jgi:phytoene desaturase
MTIQQSIKADSLFDPRPHAIVIGSGFGGMAAAVRLGARGWRVTIVEAMDRIGGRACRFQQDGFTFDAGPTIVTAPFVFEELWTISGKRMADHVTLKALDPFYAIRFNDGTVFRPTSDTERMRAEIAKIEPKDVDGFDRFLVESEKNYRVGFLKMVDKPFHTAWSMAKAMPHLGLRRADRSVYQLVSRYIRNEKIRIALSFHPLFVGGSPLRTSGVMSLISYLEKEYGVHYAMGGTHAIIEGLADLVKGHGGRILTNSNVKEIIVAEGAAKGVVLENGVTMRSDIVVSNADAATTHAKLVPAVHRGKWSEKRVAKARHSMSVFLWYFGTNKRYDDVDHHMVLMGPRYQGLLKDIFDNKHLADDFSLYLHRPSASDSSVAPENCDAFYVLAPVPNLQSGDDWEALAEPYRKKIEAYLEATVLPGLSQHVVTSKVLTPLHFRDTLQSWDGAAFAFEPTLFQLAWWRPHNIHDTVRGLYSVGAGTHPGAGMPGVVSSAKILDALVPHGSTVTTSAAKVLV